MSELNPKSLVNALAPLRVEKLVKQVDDFTLKAHFTVGVGERWVLLGKSGSGKTSLLRVLAGLDSLQGRFESGKIFLGNREITNLPPQKREVGFVFQDQALFGGLSVLDNVTFGLRMRGVPRKVREDQAFLWLEKVKLTSRIHTPIGQLSGGERQRLAFVRALIWQPKFLLLDEPFSALDSELRGILRKELIELHALWPAPLLFVTHDEADIESVATARLNLNWNPDSTVRSVSPVLTNHTVFE